MGKMLLIVVDAHSKWIDVETELPTLFSWRSDMLNENEWDEDKMRETCFQKFKFATEYANISGDLIKNQSIFIAIYSHAHFADVGGYFSLLCRPIYC